MAAEATPRYEFVYILDGVLSEEEIKDLVGRVDKFIVKNGGEILDREDWGMRPLAYPIRNRSNGYYVILYLDGPPELPAQIEKTLRIEESVLRFLTLRLDAKMKRHYVKRKAELAAAPSEESGETVAETAKA